MSHPEMLTEIDRVSGPATRLREIRAALPTRSHPPPGGRAREEGHARRPAGGGQSRRSCRGGRCAHPSAAPDRDRSGAADARGAVRAPAAQAGAARHRSDPAAAAAAAAPRGARRARVPVGDDRHLRRPARPAHQLHPARASTTASSPICRSASRSSTRPASASTSSPGSRRGTPSDAGARRGSDALERHADRSRGRAQRRPRSRQQRGGAARAGPRRADAALVRHVAAARRGLGRR